MGTIMGTKDSPTNMGARSGVAKITTLQPLRHKCIAKVLDAGPPPIIAIFFFEDIIFSLGKVF
jgi:hypothetical protein